MSAPDSLDVMPIRSGPVVVRCAEHREDGRAIGELEIEVFAAALIIDRDGILAAKASEHSGGAPAVPVSLPGASGFRADLVDKTATGRGASLPYRYVFAMAPEASVDGGLLVTVRSASPDWPAAEAVLRSMRILTRNGTAPVANDEAVEHGPLFPMIDGSSK